MEIMRKGEYQYRDGTPMFCPYCNYEYNAYYVYAHYKDIFTCEECKEQSWVDADCKRKHDTENKVEENKFDTKYPSEGSKEWQKRCGNCENQNLNYDEVPCIYCKYNEYTKTADMWKPEK